MFSRFKNLLIFKLEQLMMRGTFARFGFILVLIALVALAAGVLIRLVTPGFESMGDAVWWAFEHLVVPEYVDGDEGVVTRAFATLLIVFGSILFAGAVIAILVQWMEETTERLQQGLTPVVFSNHVIILGWTHRTPTLVAELLHTGARRERFLERHGARSLHIVIMAEQVDSELIRELRERVGDVWNDRQVLLRTGSPLHADDLERVAFRDAAVLILPGAGFAERNPEYVDAETVKTLLSVARDASESGATPPLAVVELYHGRRAKVARRVYSGDIEVIVADEIVSRIIAQSVRQRGVCGVYTELFTLNYGAALYLRPPEGLTGARFGDLRGTFDKAVLIGIFSPDERRPNLSPDPDTLLAADDLLVFIAHSFIDCVSQTVAPSTTAAPQKPPTRPAPKARRVLILGWSRKVPALLSEFARYGKELFQIDVVSSTPISDREKELTRYGRQPDREQVQQIEAGYTVPGVLRRLEPQSYDNIVLLASERLTAEEQADAITVFSYQLLLGLIPDEGKRPQIFVELLEKENENLFKGEPADFIVSPSIVSYLLSQVALHQELAALFAELSRPRGAQILLHSARKYLATDSPMRFADIDAIAAERGEIAIGVWQSETSALSLNPDRTAQLTLAPSDEVVVLASYADMNDEPD